jgi:site-specific recombinase XerD
MNTSTASNDPWLDEYSRPGLGGELTSVEKRAPGRPKGSLGAVLTDLTDRVTIEDFSFVRALLNRIEPARAFKQYYAYRYFDNQGEGVIPHGLSVQAHGRRLMKVIMKSALESGDDLIKLMAQRLAAAEILAEQRASKKKAPPAPKAEKPERELPSLEAWMESEGLDPDFYAELELHALYRKFLDQYREEHGITAKPSDVDKSELQAVVQAQIQALNLLQNRLTSYPMPEQSVLTWLERRVAQTFKEQGVETMGDLVDFISTAGRRWRIKIRGLGTVRAKRLEDWLDTNQATLGGIVREGRRWQQKPLLQTALEPLGEYGGGSQNLLVLEESTGVMVPASEPGFSPREGISPLELMLVPPRLDGTNGLFRASALNHYGARNDLEAIRTWLRSYLAADKIATFTAYRREIERFYLWCLQEAQIPLSSVSLSHAQAYQAFLKAIPAKYISRERVTREDPQWRPFRGQLDAKSQRYAIGVVSHFYTDAVANGYLTGNPFSMVKAEAVLTREMDTSRSLNAEDLRWLRQALGEHIKATPAPPASGFDLEGALRRRLSLIFHIALSTGLRRSEIVSSTVASLTPASDNGIPSEDEWMLEVLGKGRKIRTVPIGEPLRQMILAHHEDVRQMLRSLGESAPSRQAEFEKRPPLICALRAPVHHKSAQIDDQAEMANDNLALGDAGLYSAIRAFFVGSAKPKLLELERRLRDIEYRLKEAESRLSSTASDELISQLRGDLTRLRREQAVWMRRSQMTTHWMRHTFAMSVLRDNPNDQGLKMAQQLLGHASIATTQIYLKSDDTAKIRAIRNLKPFG